MREMGAEIERGNLTYLPVVPGRLEFAWHVRRHLLKSRPAVICVELPVSLEKEYLAALERLPRMSVILLGDEDEKPLYMPVEPGDAFMEALRTGHELGATLVFLEPAARTNGGVLTIPGRIRSS